jgi:hypothetical protein
MKVPKWQSLGALEAAEWETADTESGRRGDEAITHSLAAMVQEYG